MRALIMVIFLIAPISTPSPLPKVETNTLRLEKKLDDFNTEIVELIYEINNATN